MSYFTSIFHEEVIPVNEHKAEIAAYYAGRRELDRESHRHDERTKEWRKGGREVAERGNRGERLDGKGKRPGNVQDAKNRIEFAKDFTNTVNKRDEARKSEREFSKKYQEKAKQDKINDERERERKAQKESFLPEIELI